MISPLRFLTAAVLTLSFANAFAGEAVDRATRKLDNVINNNIPLDQRFLLQSKAADVRDAIEALNVSLRKLDNVVNNNLAVPYRAIVNDQIVNLKAALALELTGTVPQPPPPLGLVCMAACKSITGTPDLNYTAIGKGDLRLLAMDRALTKLRADYNCNYGAAEVGCEQEASNDQAVACQVACKSITGTPDMSYTALGQASTEMEALQKANSALKNRYNCNYGSVKVTCERR